jgi:glycolate oxidase iron-sulfur subunit
VTGYAGLATCVHCGFCLQSCPTYVATGDEADSPRGRIVLMRRLQAGTLAPHDLHLRHHLDRCLGCRACEPVCPSGVSYGHALETARAAIEQGRAPPAIVRAILGVITQPAPRRLLFGLARLVRPFAGAMAGWGRLGFAAGMLAASRSRRIDGLTDRRIDGSTDRGIQGARRGESGSRHHVPFRSLDPSTRRPVGPSVRRSVDPSIPRPVQRSPATIFEGCIQRDLFGHVNGAAARTLSVNGYVLRAVPRQGCCGALHAHAGQLDAARALARANVRAFSESPDALVVATAAGCGAMLREYDTLLAGDPLADEARRFAARVRDVTEPLAEAGPVPGAPLELTVAYDAPCHLVHAQRVAEAPLAVLRAIPGLAVAPHEEADVCCGSAGLYSLVQRGLSRAILERKLDALAAVGPDVVVTGNPGCAMHVGAGLRATGRPTPVAHPVELLDRSYARAGRYAEEAIDSRGL